MGKGKKSAKGPKSNVGTLVVGDSASANQDLQKRNVVQEDGSDSEEEKEVTSVVTSTEPDMKGYDSEEDNAAAGRNMPLTGSSGVASSTLKPLSNFSTKQKNKAILLAPIDTAGSSSQGHTSSITPSPFSRPSPTNSVYNGATPSGSTINPNICYESLGKIVVRLLPNEYQAEVLSDGRYALSAAAIGYLAQKLGH